MGDPTMTENTATLVKNHTDNRSAESTRNSAYFSPRVDIIETDTELLLYADMPGVRSEDIDLRYENGELILRGKTPPVGARGTLIFGEYDSGDFYRVFHVHETIDASKIDAEFKNGVLTVHLPKQETVQPKQVSIRT
jgi:HSP20 family molecular chaperone IbpA